MKRSPSIVSAQSAGRSSGGAGAANAAPPAGGSAYLEPYRIPVTSRTIACSVGCKSRFCSNCCLALGIKLKKRLIPVLQTFRRVMMLTFTVDPQHFAGPREAFEHVKAARCLSVTMQALRRAGVLNSGRFFCVIEWQANGWPHWHVLVDADFIPHEVLREAWNVNLRKLDKALEDTRTGFGSVRFSVSRFRSGRHAANYACAYLNKPPRHGYPQWVLDSETRKVHRYSTSKGFWNGTGGAGRDPRGGVPATPGPDDDPDEAEKPADSKPTKRRTIAQQLASCGEATVILWERDEADPSTGEMTRGYRFVQKLYEPLVDVLARTKHCNRNAKGTRAELLSRVPTMPHAVTAGIPNKLRTIGQFCRNQ